MSAPQQAGTGHLLEQSEGDGAGGGRGRFRWAVREGLPLREGQPVQRGLLDGRELVHVGASTKLQGSPKGLFSFSHLSAPCACLSFGPPDVQFQGNPQFEPRNNLGMLVASSYLMSGHPVSSLGLLMSTLVSPAEWPPQCTLYCPGCQPLLLSLTGRICPAESLCSLVEATVGPRGPRGQISPHHSGSPLEWAAGPPGLSAVPRALARF